MPEKRVIEPTGKMQVPVEIYTDHRLDLDEAAVRQLCDGASLPGVVRAIGTPDIHRGYGVPIGCVLGVVDGVVPAAAGFDINCGMQMLTLGVSLDREQARRLAQEIHQVIPLGEGKQNLRFREADFRRIVSDGLAGLGSVSLDAYPFRKRLSDVHSPEAAMRQTEHQGTLPAHPDGLPERAVARGIGQLGTLGGGNHFIEIQRIERVMDNGTGAAWGLRSEETVIMIHSGSRGFGHELAGRWMRGNRLTVLPAESPDGRTYLDQMRCAANFAFVNRYLMASLIAGVLERRFQLQPPLLFDVSHNMVSVEDGLFVHRKGATRSLGPERTGDEHGQVVLIPGSMGTASYVLAGAHGSSDTLYSVNHGAGRVMGRREALGVTRKGRVLRHPGVTEADFRHAMADVALICENPRTIREEAPQVYKDIEVVTEVVSHFKLARPVARVRPLAVLKG